MVNISLQKFSQFYPRARDKYHTSNPVIFYVQAGSASFEFPDGLKGELNEGEFTLLDTATLADVKTSSEEEFNAVGIHIEPALLAGLTAGNQEYVFGESENVFASFDHTNYLANSTLDLLVTFLEDNHPTESAELMAKALVSEMLGTYPNLRRLIHNSFELKVSQKVIQYIEKHIRGEISLEGVSRSLGMSPATLKRRLSAEGLSFSNLLKEKRINYAANQLRASHESICEIAFQSGFKSAAHFSTAFKSVQGITPKEFRSKINWNREELRPHHA
ncbi:AraC family transcriptional regulator [Vibrio sp. SCSIO 43136]|uniref:helix-turn-helix transcriptional regulator n=1 Tax=Vibrio sp. SCSIO 43136 TaxID=2819101 RepID=UPI002074B419|nr:AraC family transcriptional regulator [Vibrio sp. SCSIO 43136]USD66882.1 AraC family transcriptional regulator [Vibrio sp. SCSIO 43136]